MNRLLVTARRKIDKSLKQRGLLKTVGRCLSRPIRHAAGSLIWLSPEFRRIRREHLDWDTKHCVDTGPKIDAGWMAEIQSPNWEFGRGYHPAPPESLRSAISNLEIDCSQFCFIDFGSGKGRSLFVASDFPFREIVGVEFSASLHDVAVANVKTYQNEEQKCFEIVPVLEDAAAYEIPVRPTVFYLYDPFGEPVISEVFANIIKAIEDCDQACYVIYFNPVFAEKFEEHELFERIDAGKEFLNYWDRTRNGNKDANEFTSEVCDGERFVVYRSVR